MGAIDLFCPSVCSLFMKRTKRTEGREAKSGCVSFLLRAVNANGMKKEGGQKMMFVPVYLRMRFESNRKRD